MAQRAKVETRSSGAHDLKRRQPATAVEILEEIYYGDNFQTIPAPRFWLKDDDEFARQQLAGFMPNLLTKVTLEQVGRIVENAKVPDAEGLGPLERVAYIADYRQYLEACTV